MSAQNVEQGLRLFFGYKDSVLDLDISSFLADGAMRNLAKGTLDIYRRHLLDFQRSIGDKPTPQITTQDLRLYFLSLQERRNPGGQHQAFRTLRRFFRWLLDEGSVETNPMARLKAPRVPEQQLDPVPVDIVKAMLAVCGKDLLGLRDKALLLALADTGARASEFLAVNFGDCDLGAGTILLRETKGKRPRAVFLGKRARRAVLAYARARGTLAADAPLWASDEQGRLTYWGLRQVLRRRAEKAGIPAPSAHAFRRLFALQSLKSGLDVLSLQKLLGHADLSVINRYVKQSLGDLHEQHKAHSPADRLLG